MLLPRIVSLFVLTIPLHAAVLHCGKLIDVEKLSLIEQVSIVVEGEEILRIAGGYITPEAGEETIDLKSHTCMPGLMDMHVHLATDAAGQSAVQSKLKVAQALSLPRRHDKCPSHEHAPYQGFKLSQRLKGRRA